MRFDKNKLKKIYLETSVLLGFSFLLIAVLLVLQLHTLIGQTFSGTDEDDEPASVPTPSIRVEIAERSDTIGYHLCRNSTEHQIELFELLVLAHDQFNETRSDIDLKRYATIISRNFVADFFTLSNKNSRSDVGGLQFVSEDLIDEFKSFAIDTFYLHLNQHIEAFGSHVLPTVATTTVLSSSFEFREFEIENDEDKVDETTTATASFYEQEPSTEEIRVIVIDIEWTFEASRLLHLNDFQTSARFVLLEDESGVRIHAIELIEESVDNGYENQGYFIP